MYSCKCLNVYVCRMLWPFVVSKLPHMQRASREVLTDVFKDDWSPAEVTFGYVNYVTTTLRSENVV